MMCAKLLKHRDPTKRGRFYNLSEDFYNRVIEFYGRTLKVVLRHQTITLLVTVGTLVLTLFLYVIVAQAILSGPQDTGVILAIADAPQNISFKALADRQQALARVILKDPDVESLSSFIGVDGTNLTPNSAAASRSTSNLWLIRRSASASDDYSQTRSPQVAEVEGITTFHRCSRYRT